MKTVRLLALFALAALLLPAWGAEGQTPPPKDPPKEAPAARRPAPVPKALPAEAKKILGDAEKEIADIEKKADDTVLKALEAVKQSKKDVEQRRKKLVQSLTELEAALKKDGKAEPAKAVRAKIDQLKGAGIVAQNDPGTMSNFRGQNGKVFHFRVTGNVGGGTVWGSGPYTDDSSIAAAAVHAGVLKNGQTGVVKVTVLPGEASYTGSSKNDVTTSDYSEWGGSYKVEAVQD